MTQIKICGLQQTEDVFAAADAGADYIGLVFVPNRRRCLDKGAATRLVDTLKSERDNPPSVVGLFANQPVAEVNSLVETCSLDMAQLCGQETIEYCRQILVPVIKVIHISPACFGSDDLKTILDQMNLLNQCGYLVTLDRQVEGFQGGTGIPFDWEIAAALSKEGASYLLAGGLTPDNVSAAIALTNPWGVDVSSGVETSGVKDGQKIARFIDQVNKAKL